MNSKSAENLRVIYILYMVGSFIGATMFVGVILAYIERGKLSDSYLSSHVEKQVRIFWVWMLVLGILYLEVFAIVIPSFAAIATGYSPTGGAIGIGFVVVLTFSVVVGLFFYVLIASMRSLRKLDAGESIQNYR